MEMKIQFENGNKSPFKNWKEIHIMKITKIEDWTLIKKWFVRLRDEFTVKKSTHSEILQMRENFSTLLFTHLILDVFSSLSKDQLISE